MKIHLCLLVAASFALPASAEVKLVPVQYKHDADMLEGYLAFDDALVSAKKPAPGIVVCPEWWGTNEYPKERAKKLAALGYVAFAIDMYGLDPSGKIITTDDPKVAQTLSGAVMGDLQYLRARAKAGYDALAARPEVDKKHIAVIGYCMGGTVALELARSGAPLAGVVSFHGLLGTGSPAPSGTVKARVLACTGAADPLVPPDHVVAFEREMSDAGADWQVFTYGGAKHGFTSPASDGLGRPGFGYQEAADRRSWAAMRAHFAEIFAAA